MSSVVGRYAPSPTGALHLGNLRTALIAWLHSRLQSGRFLLRMEDLDQPRVVAGSAAQILRDLQWLGIDWDGPVVYQSARQPAYQKALDFLVSLDLVYECFCSRKDLRDAASAPHGRASVYPGTCRHLNDAQRAERRMRKQPALRLRVTDSPISCYDALLGPLQQNLAKEVGDFVIKRADGLFAYQLAVVVDDLAQNVSHVVRGADLAESTCRQHYIAGLLQPDKLAIEYWHLPLKKDANGQRMAKRDGSQSAQEWREQGHSKEQMVALFAREFGLQETADELSAADLLDQLTIQSLQQALSKATTSAR